MSDQARSAPIETLRIDPRVLRSAVEFAVAIADAGQRLRPPIAFPAELKPYLRSRRIPSAALGSLRRAIEADDDFRRRLAAGAVDELVDPIGQAWLRRDPGWESRIEERVDEQKREAEAADNAAQLKRAEKRREAAEQVAARTRAELVTQAEQLVEVRRQLDEARREVVAAGAETSELRATAAAARTATRHAEDRAKAATDRLSGLQDDLDRTRRELVDVGGQRDALLAARSEQQGAAVSAGSLRELRSLAESARRVADQLGAIVTPPGPASRRALALPGGTTRDSRRATEHLLRAGGPVLVDGYNVSMLAWPAETLDRQRVRLLDMADEIARRYGSELVVVFDGADVVGAHAGRRLVRVRYSPAGVTADDVIRSEVAAVAPSRPVVVVTNDQAIRRDVAAVGANLVASAAFVELVR